MRSPARTRGLLLLVLATFATAAGCNAYLVDEGDPSAPILVQGRVVDASGGGMSGARILVQVADDRDVRIGEAAPVAYEGTFSAGLDGTFVARVAPTPALTALADATGGVVTVTLVVFAGSAPFAFPRELRNGTWAGDAPTFVFGPDGVSASPPTGT